MRFFDHDTEAHKDDKIMLLRKQHGGAAVDAYWTILEVMYRDETEIKPNENPSVFLGLSLFLMTDVETIEKWVAAMCELGLLVCECDQDSVTVISSPRASTTIDSYQQKMLAAKENGKKGGRPKKTTGKNPVVSSEKPNGNQSESEDEPNGNQSESEAKPNDKPKKPEGEVEGEVDIQEKEKKRKEKEERARRSEFLKQVMEIYNEETKSDILEVSEDVKYKIMAIYEHGRTLDEVRAVVRDRFAEWSVNPALERWITPATILGPKFESYLPVAKRNAKREAAKRSKEVQYAQYA